MASSAHGREVPESARVISLGGLYVERNQGDCDV